MRILYYVSILFVIMQNFTAKQNDFITFKLISTHKKNLNTLIPVSKTYTKNTPKMKKNSVNKNFNILLRKLQKN